MATAVFTEEGTVDQDAANKLIDKYQADNAASEQKPEDDSSVKAEEQSGQDDAGEEEDAEGDWVDGLAEDMRELLGSLDLSDEQAREMFEGPEDLERHTNLLDKQLMKIGKNQPGDMQDAALEAQEAAEAKLAKQEQIASRPRGEDGKFVSEDTTGYEPSLSKDYFDDEVVDEFSKLNSSWESRFKSLEQQFMQLQEAAKQGEQNQKASMVYSLGHEDLFGSPDKPLTTAQKVNQKRVLEATEILQAGMKAMGQDAQVTPALMRRALFQEFAEELTTKQRRELSRQARSQGKKKLGGGKGRQKGNPLTPWTGEMTEDPVLISAWKEMQRESGDI
jgi:hypothetical protein